MKAKKRLSDKGFQNRWNEIFFYTDKPTFGIYEKLYEASADFDYIRFLEILFRAVVRFDPLIYGQSLRQSRRRKTKAISNGESPFDVLTREMKRTRSMIGCNDHPMVIAAAIMAIAEQFREPKTVRLFYATIRELLQSQALQNQRSIKKSLEQSMSIEYPEATPALLWAVYQMNAVLARISDKVFCLPKKGRQTDLLGNLILLAVAEHLREQGSGRPSYKLAAEFLKTLAPESKTTAASARIRVHKLNRSRNRQNDLLSFVNQQYLLFLNLEKFVREIAPD